MILRPLHVRAFVLVASLCGVFFCTSLARGLDPQNPPKPGPEGRGDGPQGGERPRGPRGERGAPNLHQSMEQLGRAMEQVEKTIGDATKSEETLVGLGRMIQCAGGSVAGMPKSAEQQPEDTRAAFKNAFRREILLLTRQLVDIELLVLDGKHSEAAEMFKKVATARDAAHDKFGGNEDEHERGGGEQPPQPKH